ncbi:hypothetical protein T492DRAFT_862959 [Pavlovales sp. CCMP2436]|nr:hypothetical protein T492DRAFT_862959 [Pavlovales sp. CCMP2436]
MRERRGAEAAPIGGGRYAPLGKRQNAHRGLVFVLALALGIALSAVAIIRAARFLRGAQPAFDAVVEAQTGVMRFADEEELGTLADAGGTGTLASLARAAAAAATAAAVAIERVVLQCPDYAGPLIWAWFPNGKNLKMRPVAGSKLEPPAELRPVLLPARPFALHAAALLPGSRFHTAARTNIGARYLKTDF